MATFDTSATPSPFWGRYLAGVIGFTVLVALAVAWLITPYSDGLGRLAIQQYLGRLACVLPITILAGVGLALAGAKAYLTLWLWDLEAQHRLAHLEATRADVAKLRQQAGDFTPTRRGFAPRIVGDKVVNPNIAPTPVMSLHDVEPLAEVSEPRKLAAGVGWHAANAARGGSGPGSSHVAAILPLIQMLNRSDPHARLPATVRVMSEE